MRIKVFYFSAVLFCCTFISPGTGSAANRISNGNFAETGQFPYAASLQLISQSPTPTRGHRCGATLITFQHALTTASCLFEYNVQNRNFSIITASQYRLFAGGTILTLDTTDRVRTIANFTVHPNFILQPSYVNDIAIITLINPFPNTTVIPISLPSNNFEPTDFTLCTVAGWGTQSYSVSEPSAQLLYTDKYIYSQHLCTLFYNLNVGTVNILPTMICAATFNIPSSGCQGDVGNALVCNSTLTGLLFHHGDCIGSSLPELYTRVPNYVTWIRSVTGSANTIAPGFASLIMVLTFIQSNL